MIDHSCCIASPSLTECMPLTVKGTFCLREKRRRIKLFGQNEIISHDQKNERLPRGRKTRFKCSSSYRFKLVSDWIIGCISTGANNASIIMWWIDQTANESKILCLYCKPVTKRRRRDPFCATKSMAIRWQKKHCGTLTRWTNILTLVVIFPIFWTDIATNMGIEWRPLDMQYKAGSRGAVDFFVYFIATWEHHTCATWN